MKNPKLPNQTDLQRLFDDQVYQSDILKNTENVEGGGLRPFINTNEILLKKREFKYELQ